MKEVPYNSPAPDEKTEKPGEKNLAGESHLPVLRTFHGDVNELIQNKTLTKFSIYEAQQKYKEPDAAHTDTRNVAHLGWAVFGVVLLFAFLGGISIYVLFDGHISKKTSGVAGDGTEKIVSLSNTETTHDGVIVLGTDPRGGLLADISIIFSKTNLNPGSLRNIQWHTMKDGVEVAANPTEILTALGPSSPKQLALSLGDSSTSGIVGGTPLVGYIVFSVRSYANAFAGMLNYEKKLPEEFLPYLIPGRKNLSQELPSKSFVDARVDGIDVRSMKDGFDQTVLCYGFPEQNTLIISANESAFRIVAASLKK